MTLQSGTIKPVQKRTQQDDAMKDSYREIISSYGNMTSMFASRIILSSVEVLSSLLRVEAFFLREIRRYFVALLHFFVFTESPTFPFISGSVKTLLH